MNFYDRLLNESDEVRNRINSLSFFIKVAPRYKELSDSHKSLLNKQLYYMRKYLNILDLRIDLLEKEGLNNDD